ncbi:MAG TPA: hypothetical protein IGS53_25785 [Leptolyngbyaceae cyanobacterium M33_DOE_097]|nr:hypothetical protein [Leptolyngbyaceae cyanobacterium M33_DOE_097]
MPQFYAHHPTELNHATTIALVASASPHPYLLPAIEASNLQPVPLG